MLPIPWRYVESWNCTTCGMCCKGFNVVLDFPEWMNIVKAYGIDYTIPSISKFYLKHKNDGNCVFLQNYYGSSMCSLQHMKPMACRLWPFKVASKPRYGRPKESEYRLNSMKLYVYVDPSCGGIRWGSPTPEFVSFVLPEFVDLALGQRRKQYYTTAKPYNPQAWKPF